MPPEVRYADSDGIAIAGGRVVKTAGDGALALFDRPARGIEAARPAIGGVRALGLERKGVPGRRRLHAVR